MEDLYPKAYKEVYEILKFFSVEDIKKIPKEMLDMFKYNMDKEYKYIVDTSKPFSEQKMLKETREILAVIYKNYWATEEQKKIITKKLKNDIIKSEQEKKDRFNYEDFFRIKKQQREIKDNKEMVIIKKDYRWYDKIIKKIKKIFNNKRKIL